MNYLLDICSLCLARSQNLKSILSQDTDGTMVADKLRVFLLELMHFMPNIPKYICNNCLINLNYVYRFKVRCLESIKTLNMYVQKFELQPPSTNLSVIDTKYEKVQTKHPNNNETYENETNCSQGTIALESVFIKEETEESKNLYNENTNFMEENRTDLLDVNRVEEKESLLQNNVTQEPGNILNLRSTYEVFEEFNGEKLVNENVSNNNKTVSTNNELQPPNKTHTCTDCLKPFTTLRDLNIHCRRVHLNQRPFTCSTCQKSFKQLGALRSHHLTHTGEKPYACDVCDKTFTQIGHLIGHKRVHDDVRPFKCAECGKAFRNSSNLTMHMNTHTGEKPFGCEVCEYKCTRRSKLRIHMKRHDR